MLRLFIAVPLEKTATDFIQGTVRKIEKRVLHIHDFRFLPRDNWHFTLVFLGYQEEDVVPRIENALQRAAREIRLSPLSFSRIVWGPQGPMARMIWAETTTATSNELGRAREVLEQGLLKEKITWDRDIRPYHGHITLARFHPIAKKRLPVIEQKLDFRFQPESICLMKSTLKRGGAEYETILKIQNI